MEEVVTTDLIIDTIKEWIEQKLPISPSLWVDAGMKLNVLLGEETSQLAQKEFELAQFASGMASTSEKLSVAAIKLACASNPLSKEIAILKAKIKRGEELIRLAKLRARMSDEEIKSY